MSQLPKKDIDKLISFSLVFFPLAIKLSNNLAKLMILIFF